MTVWGWWRLTGHWWRPSWRWWWPADHYHWRGKRSRQRCLAAQPMLMAGRVFIQNNRFDWFNLNKQYHCGQTSGTWTGDSLPNRSLLAGVGLLGVGHRTVLVYCWCFYRLFPHRADMTWQWLPTRVSILYKPVCLNKADPCHGGTLFFSRRYKHA